MNLESPEDQEFSAAAGKPLKKLASKLRKSLFQPFTEKQLK